MGLKVSCPISQTGNYNCFRENSRQKEESEESCTNNNTDYAANCTSKSHVMFLFQFPQIRGQIWRYLDGATVLSVRQTCRIFREDVENHCTFPVVYLDDRVSESVQFLRKIAKTSSLRIIHNTNYLLSDLVNDSECIRNVSIYGMISQMNFHDLLLKCQNLENFEMNLSSNYNFVSTRQMNITVPFLKSLELYVDREFEPRARGRDSLLKTLFLSQASVASILNGTCTPALEKFVCRVSFFDVEREELAVEYGELIIDWLQRNLLSIRDFRFTLSWKPEGSFVESLVAIRGTDQLMILTAQQVEIVDDIFRDSTDPEVFDGVGCQFERLKLIWDFLTPMQADHWKTLIARQTKLKYLTCGFVQPIKWQTFSLPLSRCSHSLVYVCLHNLAVYCRREFSPVDLSIFSACNSLRALHLSLSVFQEPLLSHEFSNSLQFIHTMSLPKGLIELTLTRFTIGTEQLLAIIAGLPHLKILALSFLARDQAEIGLTSSAVQDIWGLQKLKNMWIKDFLSHMEPIVEQTSNYFISMKDIEAAKQLRNLLAKARKEKESFGFHLVNAMVAPLDKTVEPLRF